MNNWEYLKEILEQSVKKNGDNCILTLGHLLAIIKMVDKKCSFDCFILDIKYKLGEK